MPTSPYRPQRIALRDGREVTLRAIAESDAAEIVQAFERLSIRSRYYRFMQARKEIDQTTLERGVHPRPGRDFAFVAAAAAADGIDIVGAAQYVRVDENNDKLCEFAVTVAEDWRRCGLATRLLASLVRRARRDGYESMEGWVIAENTPMLGLARKVGFKVEPVAGDATVLRVLRSLQRSPSTRPAQRSPRGAVHRGAADAPKGPAAAVRRRRF